MTFRLAGSLPVAIIESLKLDYKNKLKQLEALESSGDKKIKYLQAQWNYFENFDLLLNSSPHNNLLYKRDIAQYLYQTILSFNKKRYDLICFCIMPNHVHMVFEPLNLDFSELERESPTVDRDSSRFGPWSVKKCDINVAQQFPIVTDILRLLKGSTARQCNKMLNRTGSFWQHESYDHVVRNEEELIRIVKYVMDNPVKAKLVENAEEWEWSYCKYL